jgi:hypothetical protein
MRTNFIPFQGKIFNEKINGVDSKCLWGLLKYQGEKSFTKR